MANCVDDRVELQKLVKRLFEDFLDVIEESDSGREFHPTNISTVKGSQIQPLSVLMKHIRELAGVPKLESDSALKTRNDKLSESLDMLTPRSDPIYHPQAIQQMEYYKTQELNNEHT